MYESLCVNAVVSIILLLLAVCGDMLVQLGKHPSLLRAVTDNATHAVIASVTWIGVVLNEKRLSSLRSDRHLVEILLCGIVSSGIDVDHFISARSFDLKDAVSLSRRPILHCTTVPLVVSLILFVISYLYKLYALERLSWIILAAFLSHHIRDAARRGIWLWPFSSTPPFGTPFYLFLTALFPACLGFVIIHVQFSSRNISSISIV